MRETTVSELRQHLQEHLRQVEADGEEILILRHGRPVAKIVPALPAPSDLFGVDSGVLIITDPDDDLLETGEVWESA